LYSIGRRFSRKNGRSRAQFQASVKTFFKKRRFRWNNKESASVERFRRCAFFRYENRWKPQKTIKNLHFCILRSPLRKKVDESDPYFANGNPGGGAHRGGSPESMFNL
jgi:hypothetical protein